MSLDLAPVNLAHEQSFEIAHVEIRPATRELLREDECHVIEPRVMQLLVVLHRAAGSVVSKDDLAQLVWGGRIVGEDAINRVVSRLRSVAVKHAGGAFKIETINKVGYRLHIGEDGSVPEVVPPKPSGEARPSRRTLLISSGAATLVALTSGAFWYSRNRDDLPQEAKPLVATAEQGIYAATPDGNSDAIGALRQAVVIAPNSARVRGLLGTAYMSASRDAPRGQSQDLRARALDEIGRAFAIEPGQPDALAAQITGMPVFRNWLVVERAARAGLRAHPDHIGLTQKLMYVLAQTGRTKEMLPLLAKIESALPDLPHVHTPEVIAKWSLGRLDEADAASARSLARWPRFFSVWFTELYLRMYGGHPTEALGMIRDVANRPVGIPTWNFDSVEKQAAALASGDNGTIADAVRASVEVAHRGTGFAENAATFAAFVGDFDSAFTVLNALYFNEGFAMPDAYFAPEQGMYSGTDRHTYNLFLWPNRAMRRDPRFAQLTRRIGLDAYWQATGSGASVTR